MGFRVRIPNAFTIHQLGTPNGSLPYPFGVSSYERTDGVFSLILFPVSLVDLCDLLARFETIAVFDVAHASFDVQGVEGMLGDSGLSLAAQAKRPAVLSEIAAARDVDCHVIDAGIIVIPAKDLADLLTGLDHYNFYAFDVSKDYTEQEIVENVSNHRRGEWRRTEHPLCRLAQARFFLHSHDDCDLYLEAYDVSFLKQVFERALQMYAGTVLAEESGFGGEIAGIAAEVMEALWPTNAGLTILKSDTEARGLQLRIGVSQTEFHFQEGQRYPISLFVEYDASAGRWQISR
jgi:hypothetical protein